jgi:hypothetical protein
MAKRRITLQESIENTNQEMANRILDLIEGKIPAKQMAEMRVALKEYGVRQTSPEMVKA